MNDSDTDNYIAIVGMACRFPGARNLDEYWQLLVEGRNAVQFLEDDALRDAGVSQELIDNPDYVKAGMFMPDMEMFDGDFFGFSNQESSILDPQHRQFLECCWNALEHAGFDVARMTDAVGIFAGSGHNAYLPYNLLTNPQLVEDNGMFLLRHTGNDKDFLTTRVSYSLDLSGPSIGVATACSTSLVATHLGCQSLLSGECDVALTGGVTVEYPKNRGYLYKSGEIASPDGLCRPFDAEAAGTLFGSGVGVVVLKRYSDAIEANDNILAIVRGSAVNNDGSGKVSYLAPGIEGQTDCVTEAIEIAGVEAETISYVEAHGTGTNLGDPIEVAALSEAYGSDMRQFCGLGSVKSNIGHTDTAAGVASLIKVVLAMQHKTLPATLNFNTPNPALDLPETPFYIVDQAKPWASEGPRRAGVNSLGVGGTNAHLIVEEPAQAQVSQPAAHKYPLLPLSAKSSIALSDYATSFADYIEAQPQTAIHDMAYTLQTGRSAFAYRSAIVGQTESELFASNDQLVNRAVQAPAAEQSPVFMFAGGGAQYPKMGLELYETENVYRAAVDECLEILDDQLDINLADLLFAADGETQRAAELLVKPSYALPALFLTQYAQAKLWQSWGVTPKALIGHSMGENTAACLAGVMSLKDALSLVALRGKLFETTEPGAMLSVSLDEQALSERLTPNTAIACLNAPSYSVASGSVAEIDRLTASLRNEDIDCSRIHIDVAAHSPLLDPILAEFLSFLQALDLQPPQIPIASCNTGQWLTDEQATDPQYWVNHLRQTVRFQDGLSTMLSLDNIVLLEVGPGRTLTDLARMHPEHSRATSLISSMPPPAAVDEPSAWFMTSSLGQLWEHNVAIDWDQYHVDAVRARIVLPTYPFQRKYHWIEPGSTLTQAEVTEVADGVTAYQPVWRVAVDLELTPTPPRVSLVICDLEHAQLPYIRAIGDQSEQLLIACPGSEYALPTDRGPYRFRLDEAADYERLLSDVVSRNGDIDALVFMLGAAPRTELTGADAIAQGKHTLFSLMRLTQALGMQERSSFLRLTILTSDALSIIGEDRQLERSLLAGPVGVIDSELDRVGVQLVDTPFADLAAQGRIQNLLADLSVRGNSDERITVHRNGRLYQRGFEAVDLASEAKPAKPAQTDEAAHGGLVITGGTGGLALAAAAHLAAEYAYIALLSRRAFIPRENWDSWIETYGEQDSVSQKIAQIRDIEARGPRVHVFQCDVADVHQTEGTVSMLEEEFGRIRALIHAAGQLDDSPILAKDETSVERILEAKVLGTAVLDAVFATRPLEHFLLYASVSAYADIIGQFDYSAANHYQLAYANNAHNSPHDSVVAFGWPAWQDVGMAADLANGRPYVAPLHGRATGHPLLQYQVSENATTTEFGSALSVGSHWVIREHRPKDGEHLLPGSGYLEFAAAGMAELEGVTTAGLRDVEFVQPLSVGHDMRVDVSVTFTKQVKGYQFSVSTNPAGDGEHDLHCTGFVHNEVTPVEPGDLTQIKQRCQLREQLFDDADHHPFMEFGAHWRALRRVLVGDGEALIELDHASETEAGWILAPALVDMATAGAQTIVPGYQAQQQFYVPMGFGEFTYFKPLAGKMYSHVTLQDSFASGSEPQEIIGFDVVIYDEAGNVLAQAKDFAMRLLGEEQLAAMREEPGDESSALRQSILEAGVASDEALAVLEQVMQQPRVGSLVVSGEHPKQLLEKLRPDTGPAVGSQEAAVEDTEGLDAVARALEEHEAVDTAVVRQYGREPNTYVVAHVVFTEGEFSTNSALRKFLRADVRADLVPQHFDELTAFPRDQHGEIDRSALKDPIATSSFEAPNTLMEKSVAKIWGAILGFADVGLHDNFFDIGGHSILSIRAIAQIEKETGVRLNQKIMVLQTLEQIAKEIEIRAADVVQAEPEPQSRGLLKRVLGR